MFYSREHYQELCAEKHYNCLRDEVIQNIFKSVGLVSDLSLTTNCFEHFNHTQPGTSSNCALKKKFSKIPWVFMCFVFFFFWGRYAFMKCCTCRRKSKTAILDHSWWWISVQPHSSLGTLPFCQHFCFSSCWYFPQVNLTEEWVLLSVGLSEESQRITGHAWPAEKGEIDYSYTGILSDWL